MCKVDENKNVIVTVRVNKDTYRDLVLTARESGASVSDVVREALYLYLSEDVGNGNTISKAV